MFITSMGINGMGFHLVSRAQAHTLDPDIMFTVSTLQLYYCEIHNSGFHESSNQRQTRFGGVFLSTLVGRV